MLNRCDYFSDHIPVYFETKVQHIEKTKVNKLQQLWRLLSNPKLEEQFMEQVRSSYHNALETKKFEELGVKEMIELWEKITVKVLQENEHILTD